MNKKNYVAIVLLTTSVLFTTTIFNSGVLSQKPENLMPFLPPDEKEGHFLYTPYHSKTTYLINETGAVNHTWQSNYYPLYDSYMGENGSIYLAIQSGQGGIQKIAYDGTILWEYHYTRDSSYATHDITLLPNGDFIIIMQEIKSHAQAVQAGRDPNTVGTQFYPNMLIQVNQTGPTSGDIVWEWHVWDHLIQDFNPNYDNYGNVSQHPELADINFDQPWCTGWPYFTSVDYNPKFDQLLISAHNFDEVWVIDHSTTTDEAASHEGGDYGHGGDLLYRWGNPQTYDRGDPSDKQLYFQHQSCWIKPGLPGAGNILVFSNGVTRPGGTISSVDEFTPDVDNDTGTYYLPPGGTYGPDDLTWQYLLPSNLYSYYFGGAQRMLNNNTLICSGWNGVFIEVTADKQIVWTYDNPYPTLHDQVYRTQYIPPYQPPPPPPPPPHPDLDCNGSLSWSRIKPGATVHGSFQVLNRGVNNSRLNWTINNTITWGTWTFIPESGGNITPEHGPFTVHVYCMVPNENNTEFHGNLTVQNKNNASDYVDIPVTLTTSTSSTVSVHNPFLLWLFKRLPHAFPLLRHLLM
ncbi:MAG: aryl-sulfate sulfotransferase [Candidatus Thermoplasmatota archaeon]|nr:aryl-sulfate sulfotransferase [Candidatus Thermoplasmatota archaeon]